MVKRLLASIALLLTATTMMAQYNIFARMNGIPNGHPKQVIINDGQECHNYDAEGRLISAKDSMFELQYKWDGDIVTIENYQNGVLNGSDMVLITCNTPEKIVLTTESGLVITTYFNKNNIGYLSQIEGGGQSMEIESIFLSPDDYFPYATLQTSGNMSDQCEWSDWVTDAQGNWISNTITYNGQSMTQTRSITYY